jgi:hypothetical protein
MEGMESTQQSKNQHIFDLELRGWRASRLA